MVNRHSISAVIPEELYIKVKKSKYGLTEAIILGLEKLFEPAQEEKENDQRTISQGVFEANDGLIQSLEARTSELNKRIESLEEQLKVKDKQLEKKDTQLENLTNTMQSQAINIHDLLNQKAIEAPGAKKPWWQFW